MRTLLSMVFLTAALSSAAAQIQPGDQGFYLRTTAAGGGSLCRGFTCTPYLVGVGPNESVTLEVRGPFGAPFWAFAAPRATLCLTLPGLRNSLVLAPPIFFLTSGTLSLGDPILSCPGGLQKVPFRVALPPNVSFAMQGVVMAVWQQGPLPTLTPAIDVVVK